MKPQENKTQLQLKPDQQDVSYSLELDMLLGWVPKTDVKHLMTLKFNSNLNDQVISTYRNRPNLVYLGFRPSDTGQLHREFSSPLSYPHKGSKSVLRTKQTPFLGMNPAARSAIVFNSMFESGNLDIVIRVSEAEYDLFMRVDSNTRGHTSWYNFTLNGVAKGERIRLNICNFSKSRSLYERGMRPYVLRKSSNKWEQGGENVTYECKKIPYADTNKVYKCLSFDLEGDGDMIQVSYCIPYTYTQMLQYIGFVLNNGCHVERSNLCETLSGVQVPILTFSDGQVLNKKLILVQARVHPGESNGSWVMQGFMEFLMSPASSQLLQSCVIKVIPMLNPDGVILGNYRTGCAGKDLNRRFIETDPVLFPTVFALKALVKELHTEYGKNFFAFLDLHGHSVKKNAFFYGPEFPVWNPNYYRCRLLPKLMSQLNTKFRYHSCIYRLAQQKRATARGVFFDQYQFLNCFTMETSNGGYYQGMNNFSFNRDAFLELGRTLGNALVHLVESSSQLDCLLPSRISIQTQAPLVGQKKRSFSTNEQTKQTVQSSPYGALFEEILNEPLEQQQQSPDQSLSEGRSDSESSDEDLNISQLERLRNEVLRHRPDLRRVRVEKSHSRHNEKRPKHQNMLNTLQLVTRKSSEKRIPKPQMLSAQVKTTQDTALKQQGGIKTFRATFQRNQKTFVEQVPHFQEEVNELQLSHNDPPKSQISQQMRPQSSKVQLNVEFQPLMKEPNQTQYFKGHTRMKSSQSIKRIVEKVGMKSAHKKQGPSPLLAQLGITAKPSNIQQPNFKNLEQLGILVKPKLFVQKVMEDADSFKQTIQGPPSLTDSSRPFKSKALVPSSFYSVNKHLMNRVSLVRNKL